jgi:hypothetical protein
VSASFLPADGSTKALDKLALRPAGYIIAARSKNAAAASTKIKARQKSAADLVSELSTVKSLSDGPGAASSAACERGTLTTLGFGCLGSGKQNSG